jgi:hypothetical protein
MLVSETPRWNYQKVPIELAVSWIILSSFNAGVSLAVGLRHGSPERSLFLPVGGLWLLSSVLSGCLLIKRERRSQPQ